MTQCLPGQRRLQGFLSCFQRTSSFLLATIVHYDLTVTPAWFESYFRVCLTVWRVGECSFTFSCRSVSVQKPLEPVGSKYFCCRPFRRFSVRPTPPFFCAALISLGYLFLKMRRRTFSRENLSSRTKLILCLLLSFLLSEWRDIHGTAKETIENLDYILLYDQRRVK